MAGQWRELPRDLLDAIEGNLILYSDKVRVRTVCASWNSQLPKLPNQQLRKHPWLLLQGNDNGIHSLFDPFEKKFYHLDLPEARRTVFKGSSHGWIVTMEDITSTSPADIYLINPFTRARIKLPPRSTFPDVKDYNLDRVGEEYILINIDGKFTYSTDADYVIMSFGKVVLSSNPYDENCFIIAIYDEFARLAYCKCNDKKWAGLDIPSSYPDTFVDIAFFEQKLYAINEIGQVVMIENIGPNPNVTCIVMTSSFSLGYNYLAWSYDGDLTMVSQYFDDNCDGGFVDTCRFKVFKPNFSSLSWDQVENVGENTMIFVGISLALSVSSHDFSGLKGNCIYYTDSPETFECSSYKPGCIDPGVFIFDEEISNHILGLECDPKLLWPPPVWLLPG